MQAIAELAARQHGNITRAQLRAAGLTNRQIDRRLESGQLLRRHHGVYAVSYLPLSPVSRAAAAVLAGGPTAALSHDAAHSLWRGGEWREPIEITTRTRRRPAGLWVHHSSELDDQDITIHWGIRVTTPARTLLDIAPRYTRHELARFANELKARHFLHHDDIPELLERLPGRPGAHKLDPHARGYTRSGPERRFQRFCAERGLPVPLTNTIVLGREVDAYFPQHQLIVELDTDTHHADPNSFERDRDNDATALAHGIKTVRITAHRLQHHPDREERRLRTTLGSRRSG
jgi:hypothetical protein